MQAEKWLDASAPVPVFQGALLPPANDLPSLAVYCFRRSLPPAVAAEVQSFPLVVQGVLGGHSEELINACCVVSAASSPMRGSLRQVGIHQEEVIHRSLDCTVSLGPADFCRPRKGK